MLSLMLMKQKIAKLKLASGVLSRALVMAVAVSLLAAPSFVQAQDNRVFVELSRTTGAAGAFIEAVVYVDKADPADASVTTSGFNAIGASLAWTNGAFTWNVDTGGTPIMASANLMLMAAPGATPNFELLQSVSEVGRGVFFETDQTSSVITVTIVETDFASVDDQILSCTFESDPPSPSNLDNCNAFPIFRATLQVDDEPVPDGMTEEEFHDVIAMATPGAQSPAPGDDFVAMTVEDQFDMLGQTEQSRLTVTSAIDTSDPFTLDTVSGDFVAIGDLGVARSNEDDGLEARLMAVVWTISSDNAEALGDLIDGNLLFVMDTTLDNVDQIDAEFGEITANGANASAEIIFRFPDISSTAIDVAGNTTLTISVSLDLSDGQLVDDGAEYSFSLTRLVAVGRDSSPTSAPPVDLPGTAVTATLQLQVMGTQLRLVYLGSDPMRSVDLDTITAGRIQTFDLVVTDALGNLDTINSIAGAVTLSPSTGTVTPVSVMLPTGDAGSVRVEWSHWPTEDMQDFMLTLSFDDATAGISDAQAEGISDAVADTLSFAAIIMVVAEGDEVGDATEEESLMTGATNTVSITLMTQACTDALNDPNPQPCVTDTGIDENVSLSVIYTFNTGATTEITNIGNSEVVSGTDIPEAVDFSSGVATLQQRVFMNPQLAEDVDQAPVTLAFSAIFSIGTITGDDMLVLVPGGPDFTLDVSGNGAAGRNDLLMIFRSRFSTDIDPRSYDGIARGFDIDISAGGLSPPEILERIEGFNLATDVTDVSGNGTLSRNDLLMIFRSRFSATIDPRSYDGIARGFDIDIDAGGLSPTEILERIQQVNSTATP